MVHKSRNGKYLKLDDVRVFYNKKKDTVHLSSTDEDFPSGFHMTLNKGSQTDEMLREILEDQGMLEANPKVSPSFDYKVELIDHGVTAGIPLGKDAEGNIFSWEPMKSLVANMPASLYVQARVGMGKSILLDHIVIGLKLRNYEVLTIDALELRDNELEETVIPELMQKIDNAPERFALVFNEFSLLLENDNFRNLFLDILRTARSKSFVVIASCQNLEEDYLPYFTDHIVIARSDVKTSQTIFGDDISSSASSNEFGLVAFRSSLGGVTRFKLNSKLNEKSKIVP